MSEVTNFISRTLIWIEAFFRAHPENLTRYIGTAHASWLIAQGLCVFAVGVIWTCRKAGQYMHGDEAKPSFVRRNAYRLRFCAQLTAFILAVWIVLLSGMQFLIA